MPSAGRVGKPHGLDGSFHVTQPTPQLLDPEIPLRVGETPARIASRKGTDAKPILRLDIASDRTAIEALRGSELLVDDKHVPPLEEDEYWAEDLVGCEVAGHGAVVRMLSYPSCEVLETADGSMIPLVRDAIARIDVEARVIELAEGFLDAD